MNDLGFTTNLTEKDISTSLEEISAEATIHWGVELEIRSWGVKDIVPFIKSVAITYIADDGSVLNREFVGNKVSLDISDAKNYSMYPKDIYYTDLHCTVYF